MSQREKLTQLKNIVQILENQKNEDVILLNNLKAQQQQRIESLNKLIHYKSEYMKANARKSDAIPPILHNNFEMFIQKLNHAITNEKLIIEDLEHRKVEIIAKISQQDQKIDAMQLKITELSHAIANQQDIAESTAINELYTQKASKEQL